MSPRPSGRGSEVGRGLLGEELGEGTEYLARIESASAEGSTSVPGVQSRDRPETGALLAFLHTITLAVSALRQHLLEVRWRGRRTRLSPARITIP